MTLKGVNVTSKAEAWSFAQTLIGSALTAQRATERCDTVIFEAEDGSGWICDLGCRLEVNLKTKEDKDVVTLNVWIHD